VKVPTSFWEASVAFPAPARAAIDKLLCKGGAEFIERAQLAAGEYQHLAKAWAGPTPATIRRQIEELARVAISAEKALAQLPDAAESCIEQAQALNQSYRTNGLTELQKDLKQLASACERAAQFKVLNKGRGKTVCRNSIRGQCIPSAFRAPAIIAASLPMHSPQTSCRRRFTVRVVPR
jgi:hypothetical protein